ncbi:MAG TPA: acyl-CoA thioesterase [Gemmatimonadales bacterium]|nr:acyl-CoA thioesterase [Gemmatimonadales bacterium]
MSLWFRLFRVLLRALRYRSGTFDPLGEARLTFRVLPTDLDLNLHMNNARYLALMDLGRVDLLNRMGLIRLAFRGRWFPVLGAVALRFHRPLQLWDQLQLATRITGWDEKWFYLEQRFERGGTPIATAHVKALLRSPEGSVPTKQVLTSLGRSLVSPPLAEAALRLPE